jgi:PAS domain S-box-containing protein
MKKKKKLSLIARQTVNAVIITDSEQKITWVNSAFTHITEYQPEEVIGRKPGTFLQGKETDPLTVQYLREKIKAKEPFDCEIINYSKSGRKYWMHIQGQPLLDENGNIQRYFAMETDVTEKILLERKLVQERLTRQIEISSAVLKAQENERENIGKELHDNLNQILGAAKLYIEMARTDEENREMFLGKSSRYILKVIDEIRKISKTLATPGTHVMGLSSSIKVLLDDMIMVHPIKIEFQQEGIDEEKIDKKLQLDIFRIVQEQLNNILKHSKATHASIHLTRQEDEIDLLISDNGEGCDILKENGGMGILNIKSRAESYHGVVTIVSKPGEGFELNVVLPLNAHTSNLPPQNIGTKAIKIPELNRNPGYDKNASGTT